MLYFVCFYIYEYLMALHYLCITCCHFVCHIVLIYKLDCY
jgi:hypothetical protein